MNVIESATLLRRALAPMRGKERIALVPTMGCLHEGHLSLIRKAKRLADIVVVSIYVNPLQFGPGEDLDAYPRPFDEDVKRCEAEGVDILFHPQNLYPDDGPKVTLKVEELDSVLCGARRPGHFDGVVTVVNILFNIIQPDIAIFGEKDFQQMTVIQRMAGDLQLPVEIVGAPTMREEDGLAMSSRNRYLDDEERQQAAALFAALTLIQRRFREGETDTKKLVKEGRKVLAAQGIKPEYLEIRDARSLAAVSNIGDTPCRIFIAAKIGKARLIDNIPLAATSATEMPV